MHPLKAVIFDYGKVLSLPPTPEQWNLLSSRFGKPLEEFQPVYWGKNREALDRGVLNNVAYWQKVGSDCGTAISESEAQALIDLDNTQWTNENLPMVEFAADLRRAGYKTAILSNMERRMLGALRAKLPWLDQFDVQIYSCEVGMVKPEAEIYQLCCQRLGYAPEQALFLDDKKPNVEGARRVGLEAYLYQSAPDPVMRTGGSEISLVELRSLLLFERAR